MSLLSLLESRLRELGVERCRVVAAVSGGPDSVALLDLLAGVRERLALEIVVGHVDHGIHPASGSVAERVERLATDRGLACEIGRLELGPEAGETEARAARWRWLQELRLRRGAALVVTAHHADDQAETVLMRLLRGSGPAGLAAMSPRTRATSGGGPVVRPLLDVTHAELAEHLRLRGLEGWKDPANTDPRHLRSWLRSEVMPRLRERLPDVDARLVRSAAMAAADRAAWDALLDTLPGLDCHAEPGGVSVAAPVVAGYDSAVAEALLRAAARRAGCVIGPRRARRVLALVEAGRSGTTTPLGGSWSAELSCGRLRFVSDTAAGTTELASWALEGERGEREWAGWRLSWRREAAPTRQERGGLTAWFAAGTLEVRAGRSGERIHPLRGPGRRLLVRCFQDARVPRGRRPHWPVLASGDAAVWVPGVCRSNDLLPVEGAEALRVDAAYG